MDHQAQSGGGRRRKEDGGVENSSIKKGGREEGREGGREGEREGGREGGSIKVKTSMANNLPPLPPPPPPHHTHLPVMEDREAEGLALCVCAKVCLEAERVYGWNEGLDGIEWGPRDWGILSDMASGREDRGGREEREEREGGREGREGGGREGRRAEGMKGRKGVREND